MLKSNYHDIANQIQAAINDVTKWNFHDTLSQSYQNYLADDDNYDEFWRLMPSDSNWLTYDCNTKQLVMFDDTEVGIIGGDHKVVFGRLICDDFLDKMVVFVKYLQKPQRYYPDVQHILRWWLHEWTNFVITKGRLPDFDEISSDVPED